MRTYIVESDRRNLHQTETDHSIAKLQANPHVGTWILSAKSKDQQSTRCHKEWKEKSRQSVFSFSNAMTLVAGLLDKLSVGKHMGVDISNNTTYERTNVNQASVCFPKIRWTGYDLGSDG